MEGVIILCECEKCGFHSKDYFDECPKCGCGDKQLYNKCACGNIKEIGYEICERCEIIGVKIKA